MRFSLTSLVKMIGMLAVLACVVAIGLARMAPVASHFRMKSPPIYAVINSYGAQLDQSKLNFLDITKGSIQSVGLPRNQYLDFASCSPWVDDRGEYQVVGRFAEYQHGKGVPEVVRVGVARYAMPSGRLISTTPGDTVPNSRPCWYPGHASRILFAGGDGRLYQMDFSGYDAELADEPIDNEDYLADTEMAVEPVAIAWACKPPHDRMVISDPFWSDDPRLGGKLIVSLSYWTEKERKEFTPGRLWWLKLNVEGTEIVEASPLDASDRSKTPENSSGRVRFPSIAATPTGGLVLAYLWQGEKTIGDWQVRIESLEFDAKTREPMSIPSSAKTITAAHVGTMPQFSADGRWLYAILRNQDPARYSAKRPGTVVRYEAETQPIEPSRTIAGLVNR